MFFTVKDIIETFSAVVKICENKRKLHTNDQKIM